MLLEASRFKSSYCFSVRSGFVLLMFFVRHITSICVWEVQVPKVVQAAPRHHQTGMTVGSWNWCVPTPQAPGGPSTKTHITYYITHFVGGFCKAAPAIKSRKVFDPPVSELKAERCDFKLCLKISPNYQFHWMISYHQLNYHYPPYENRHWPELYPQVSSMETSPCEDVLFMEKFPSSKPDL